MSKGLAVTEIPGGYTVDSDCDLGLRAGIRQVGQPLVEYVFPGPIDVMENRYSVFIVTYRLQRDKRSGFCYAGCRLAFRYAASPLMRMP